MRKVMAMCLTALVLLSSCYTRTGTAAMRGASMGALFGGSLGGVVRGYRGHAMGTMIGMVAGAAAGTAIAQGRERDTRTVTTTAPRRQVTAGTVAPAETTIDQEVTVGSCPMTLVSIKFVDTDGNQVINRGEDCKLIVELRNDTREDVPMVVPYLDELTGNKQIYISPTTSIESVPAGRTIRYTAVVRGASKLKDGMASFRLSVSCDNEDFVTLKTFKIPTSDSTK